MKQSIFKQFSTMRKSIRINSVIILLIALFVVSVFDAGAQKKSDQLKQNKQKLEKEISNTQAILNQTRQNKNASLQQLSVLRRQISNREQFILALNSEISALEEEMALNVKLSKSLDRKLNYMKADYSTVVYNAYKNRRQTNKLVFLLSAENFGQMFRSFKYYSSFANNVKSQMEQIQEAQREIQQKELEIQAIKSEKAALLAGHEQQLSALEKEKNEKDKLTNDLKKKEKQLAAEIRKKQQEQQRLDKAIKKAIEDEIKAANNRKKKANSDATTSGGKANSTTELLLTKEEKALSSSFAGNQGKLPWPVAKCAKIRDFGTYAHPDVPSVTMQNNGIDLATEAGATVRAVFQGEVSSVLEYVGTKIVIIKHGEYMTVYQNLGSVSVKKGDKVTTKQAIGTVAKNTSSNTYELHFELWKNTTHLNPSTWLAR